MQVLVRIQVELGKSSPGLRLSDYLASAPPKTRQTGMDSSEVVDEVISAFKDRNLLIKRDAIESALTEAAHVEWVSKHLRPDTLLYTKLESSGALQSVIHNLDLDATRPLLEDDLRTAIESLEASTATIQKQAETLELQCEILQKQLGQENSLDQDRTRDIARLRKKHEAGRQSTTVAANGLSDELEASFRNASDQTGAESKRILASLSTRLKQDDKTLVGLEALISGIKSHGNGASTAKQTGHLAAMLADYVAEEIHYRLDRLYLEAIQSKSEPHPDATVEDETITALEDELESLYTEIEILAEMSTKQQFNEPILREIQNEHAQLREVSQQKLEQVLDILIEMTLSKQALKKRLEDRESSCELLEQLATLYQSQAGSQMAPQQSSRRESLRRRSIQPGVLFANTRNPATPAIEQPALENLLRRIGVSPESALRPQVEDGGARGLHEKRIHMSETLQHLKVGVDVPLVAHLAPLDNASQLLTSSLHANSHFETSLPDPDQENALLGLEAELASLQRGVQRLNLDVLHQRDKTQDTFLERWA
ncbi:hypothetical protein NUU61_008856 [Penicillium alfredii]|uniref:HAUS augmin-like complex subunit 3 N-terminal domain-containing protein n=1 Tax=Penicillium alfredii TaxID=1506179 RepID=A0A9W9EM06_9EURO|nr:uncharacterized protein NUU61_008856 [Penicillium alfredii]KAJ5084277.1 hypothetical protein NUU61_008856 [Penicillium alfredii]